MTRHFAFNGDADGLCALTQLRLAEPGDALLSTGVKRDISLLSRVRAAPGDECTVLDVSLDVNRPALLELLAAGVSVRYFDHHHAGALPDHPRFEAHLDPAPNACTSLLVDRYLGGRQRGWAIVGAFGDNLAGEALPLAQELGLSDEATACLRELGVCLNYNAYGETLADLHISPSVLAEQMLSYVEPLTFARDAECYGALVRGYAEDMAEARRLAPARRAAGALMYVLPDEAWARRASGALANELTTAHADSAIAILSPKKDAGYVVSVRVPRQPKLGADVFCRRYPTGGGRVGAAGINHLASPDLERFAEDFERTFALDS